MDNKGAGYLRVDIQPLVNMISVDSALTFSDSKHLSAAYRAYSLSCRLTILHGYRLSIFHFPFGTAFHTVSLHQSPPFCESVRSVYHSRWNVNPPPSCISQRIVQAVNQCCFFGSCTDMNLPKPVSPPRYSFMTCPLDLDIILEGKIVCKKPDN